MVNAELTGNAKERKDLIGMPVSKNRPLPTIQKVVDIADTCPKGGFQEVLLLYTKNYQGDTAVAIVPCKERLAWPPETPIIFPYILEYLDIAEVRIISFDACAEELGLDPQMLFELVKEHAPR